MIIIFILLFFALIGALYRNHELYQYRKYLGELVSEAALKDIYAGINDYQWRFEKLQSVSYERMLWVFWRRFESFYDDWSFVHPSATESPSKPR